MRTLPHVPTFQDAYKTYRVTGGVEMQSPVGAKFRCRVAVGQ